MVDWIVDNVRRAGIEDIQVVTNARFAPRFEAWADGVTVLNDGTDSNENRLGAIGDMQFVIDAAGLDDDLLVIAGDNLFDYSLRDFVGYWRGKGVASAVAVRDVGSRELAKQYGIVAVDGDDRIVDFVEKPPEPQSTLAATATYLYHRDHARLIAEYLGAREAPDQPGKFVAWLHRRAPVYGWRFDATWYDIGNHAQLLEADNRMRAAAGLPERAEYSPT
jgi:glucose-1-phosphate thymidylyltransferase